MKNKMKTNSIILAVITSVALVVPGSLRAHEGEEHGAQGHEESIKGEVVDLACYVDHGAIGEKHADCAKKCIESGLPVGIKAADGRTYVIIGAHQPMNHELAGFAAKTISVKGKVVARDGINLIDTAEIVK